MSFRYGLFAFLADSDLLSTSLQTCASDAVLTSVVAARITYLREYPDTRLEDLLIYTTTQTHSLGTKGGLILGIPVRSLQVTAVDNYRLRGETLRRALEEDTASGKRPFFMSKATTYTRPFPPYSYLLAFRSCDNWDHLIWSNRRFNRDRTCW